MVSAMAPVCQSHAIRVIKSIGARHYDSISAGHDDSVRCRRKESVSPGRDDPISARHHDSVSSGHDDPVRRSYPDTCHQCRNTEEECQLESESFVRFSGDRPENCSHS